jgi:hypothetical protein
VRIGVFRFNDEGGGFMELARWLVAFVAFITGIGGLLADYFLASGAQHIKNPLWSPHAKFHNAQGILMGALLAGLTIAVLFRHRVLSREALLLAALIASVYWFGIFAAPIFPGVAFVDPEFQQERRMWARCLSNWPSASYSSACSGPL